jgi:hypothetical protein
MEKRFDSPVAASDVGRTREEPGGDSADLGNPIRKQSPEDRRRYMREYMRAYRLQRPGLSAWKESALLD